MERERKIRTEETESDYAEKIERERNTSYVIINVSELLTYMCECMYL